MSAAKAKLYEVDLDQDIRYRGPLTYRHFKIFGWVCIFMASAGILMNLGISLDAGLKEPLDMPMRVCEVAGALALPFLLFANFAQILATEDYKHRLMVNGIAAVAIIVFFLLIYNRYIIGFIEVFVGTPEEARGLVDSLFAGYANVNFIAFNVFIDLFLCTSYIYFLLYHPKKYFQGKRIYLFRAFALLPVAYEVAAIVLKFLAAGEMFVMPVNMFPFLTTKPPMMLFAFLAFGIYLKRRERTFCKNGRSHEEYREFLATNLNSWQFGRHAAIIMAVFALIDLAIVLILSQLAYNSIDTSNLTAEQLDSAFETFVYVLMNVGFGKSVSLLFVAPLMLLFSYTRTYENTAYDLVIPLVAIVLISFLFFEGFHYGAQQLPAMLGVEKGFLSAENIRKYQEAVWPTSLESVFGKEGVAELRKYMSEEELATLEAYLNSGWTETDTGAATAAAPAGTNN